MKRLISVCAALLLTWAAGCKNKDSGGATEAVCGNGQVEGDEVCDDGNETDGDGCDSACRPETGWLCDASSPTICTPICGDSLLIGSEQCDDGNTLDCDGCSSICIQEGCGNGFEECDEECDDGNTIPGDGCSATCTAEGPAVCGNGTTEQGEQCDDGNTEDCDGCSADCQLQPAPVCGDSNIECAEECDDGNTNAGDGCSDTCMLEVAPGCGNGVREVDEECDDGNNIDCDGCSADCRVEPAPSCGNDLLECNEICDGTDLDGQTCAGLGFVSGPLRCADDCTFDTSGCLACGNGAIDGNEACDSTNLNGQTCETLGHDGGQLGCASDCSFDRSGCVDCAPGLEFCLGNCVDLMNDHASCGVCGRGCGVGENCVGGFCRALNYPWNPVGHNPVTHAEAHDLSTESTYPAVAFVSPMGFDRQVYVARYVVGPSWETLDPTPSGGIPNLNQVVALQFAGNVPYVMFSEAFGMGGVHIMARQGNGWQEIGAPGFASACSSHSSIDFVLDGTTPHLTTFGAGGCALGIDYAWWNGAAWSSHPSPTSWAGQITENGAGNSAIVFTDRAYVGVPDSQGINLVTHTVRFWDSTANAWSNLVGPLDVNNDTGWEEHMALTADPGGNIYAAWSEVGPSGQQAIYVKVYNPTSGTWSQLGAGRASGPDIANAPSIAVVGTIPYIAYVEAPTNGANQVLVRRFHPPTNNWQLIGGSLNQDGNSPAFDPVIVGIEGIPYVAFREGSVGSQMLYVKRFAEAI